MWRTAKLRNTARADAIPDRIARSIGRRRSTPRSNASDDSPAEDETCAPRVRQSASRGANLEGSAPFARGERHRNDGGDVLAPRPIPSVRSLRPASASRASPKPKPSATPSPTLLSRRAAHPASRSPSRRPLLAGARAGHPWRAPRGGARHYGRPNVNNYGVRDGPMANLLRLIRDAGDDHPTVSQLYERAVETDAGVRSR